MELLQKNTLGKQERLKSRKAIQQLFTNGNSFSHFPYRVTWAFALQPFAAGTCLQAGFSASTRSFKKATDRNKIKRLTKEAYRLQKAGLKNTLQENEKNLQVFFIYVDKALPKYDFVFAKMKTALQRLQKQILSIEKT
jgi:ribonuclease P protein component